MSKIKQLHRTEGIERVQFVDAHHGPARVPKRRRPGQRGPRQWVPRSETKTVHIDFQLRLDIHPLDGQTHVILSVWSAAWAARALYHVEKAVDGIATITRLAVALDAGVVAWLRRGYRASMLKGRVYGTLQRGRHMSRSGNGRKYKAASIAALQVKDWACPQVIGWPFPT